MQWEYVSYQCNDAEQVCKVFDARTIGGWDFLMNIKVDDGFILHLKKKKEGA